MIKLYIKQDQDIKIESDLEYKIEDLSFVNVAGSSRLYKTNIKNFKYCKRC